MTQKGIGLRTGVVGLLWVLLLAAGQAWSDVEQLLMIVEEGGQPVVQFKPEVEDRLRVLLNQAGLRHPLQHGMSLLVFKEERLLELWINTDSGPRFVKRYPVLAMSGHGGPKLRQGDLQVPEGLYQVVWRNPYSAFHLSLKLDYPNTFDLLHAGEEDRTDPGGDIFIHGGSSSVGCVAVGDRAIEELYVLSLMVGDRPTEVIMAPHDLRLRPEPAARTDDPVWLPNLYREISARLLRYTAPVADGSLLETHSRIMATGEEKHE